MKKQIAIIGLGRFGGSLCKEFFELGMDVLAIDNNIDRVHDYVELATQAVEADTTEEQTLKQLGVNNFDNVIVAIGENIQASILTTLLLKELGVKKVWVKAQNDYHQKVLEKIGADRIIHPERDMAKRVVHHIVSEKVLDFIELSDEHSIVEIEATKKLANQTLVELDTRRRFGCTIVAIKERETNHINVSPPAATTIDIGDVLVVIGQNDDIARFEREGL
jgi:trk system potassium uptake protein TrkA